LEEGASLAAVEPDIRPVGGELDVERNAPADRQTQRRVVLAQTRVHVGGEPALVTEFERVSMVGMSPEGVQELAQTREIHIPATGKLKEHRSKGVSEAARIVQ